MEIPTLDARPLELESVLDSDCVAIGFSKSDVGEITFPIATSLVRKIESKFQLNLQDELSFFATTGKVGEIFEIPVSAPGLKCQRLIFVGLGRQTPSDMRASGAALGRKVRGMSRSLFSLVASSRGDTRLHAVALLLGTYQWNLKSGPKKTNGPKFYVGDTHKADIVRAAVMAKFVFLTRDWPRGPSQWLSIPI
jgi:leucyl aminopeptidase